ncbi:DUF4189 domain-containing protein [Nocardia stercoris]|uniref:DUF4189 domain-containing protein n=1 Tax=Nocardia stercoris TaxID=2483361 RepID=A0A3M2KUB8_9NOCA|nr:DUF4189 domain-containing protein [Nocardia stercoris]RMI28050.1 DUF4189 domain-containing protein [Nocardia stercoris]
MTGTISRGRRMVVGGTAGLLLAGGLVGAGAAQADGWYYGAIAVDSHGNVGKSWDYDDSSSAEQRALDECGNSDCTIVASFSNGCGAVSDNGDRYSGGTGDDLGTAENVAGGNIIAWVCTSGHS